MADHRKMWESLGLDMESHDQLMNVLPSTYGTVYLSQENRPKGMEYFDFVVNEVHGQRIQELQDHKAAGGKVIGAFCVYVPEEIVRAAGGSRSACVLEWRSAQPGLKRCCPEISAL